MPKFWPLQFSLRTLLVAMLVLGVAPWLVTRYLTWQENEVWNAFNAAVRDRNAVLLDWRSLHSVRNESNTWKQAEADARNRYFAAEQKIDGNLKLMRSICGESSERLQQATEIREGRRAIPNRDVKSLAKTTE